MWYLLFFLRKIQVISIHMIIHFENNNILNSLRDKSQNRYHQTFLTYALIHLASSYQPLSARSILINQPVHGFLKRSTGNLICKGFKYAKKSTGDE